MHSRLRSIRSQRDSLSRELAELSCATTDLAEEVARLEELVAKLSARKEALRKALEDDLEVEDEEPPRWEGKDLTEFRLG
eukprot:s1874_g10.t1